MGTVNSQHFFFSTNSNNRRSSLLLLIILSISLTFLGIRLPWSVGISSGKVKPRPKAVIQNQIKSCKQIIKAFSAEPALPESIFTVTAVQRAANTPLLTILQHTASPLHNKLSRAPPQIFPTI